MNQPKRQNQREITINCQRDTGTATRTSFNATNLNGCPTKMPPSENVEKTLPRHEGSELGIEP
jgi:hypothetical protein